MTPSKIGVVDLDALAKEHAALSRKRRSRTDEDNARIALIEQLQNQLFCPLKRYADNVPQMIRKADFEQYAMQYAEDIGAVKDATSWPCFFVDWPRAAAELAQNFQEVTFDGEAYLLREF